MATVHAEGERYEVLEVIGRGAFGIIRKVRRKSDGHVLCRKEINYLKMSTKEREQLYAEFSILSTLKHPNIVGYYHREHLKNSQDLHIYMEYCGGGDLGTIIKNLKTTGEFAKEEFVWRIFAQLVAALYRCHYGVEPPEPGSDLSRQKDPRAALKGRNQSVMILHRDLKPENIFLGDDQSVKLGDFGLSKLMQSHDFASTYVGTPFYMSPEICQAETYNMRSDIWSLGCIMYELCAKEPPFNAKTHIQLAQNIRKGVYKDLPSIYSKDLQNVIANCLKVNPKFRPDTASLLTIPYVWIARKGLELVETGKAVRAREELAMQKLKQAEERLASLDRERELMHQQIEDNLRRKWEVKARLEIDRQIELGMERLQKRFDEEVNAKAQEIAKSMTRATEERALRDLPNRPAAEKDKENIIPQSSVSASGEEDFPSTTDLTDLSALSLESPNTSTNKPPAIRKSSKTPFARSKTTFDSPIDVQMGEPSPMSISSLALSPRRNAAAQAAATAANKNIFTEAARQRASEKWEPTLAYNSDDDGDEDEEDIPELLSPTRPKVHARDPFKMPARPGLARQATTATMQKLTTQPTLFPTMAKQGGTGSGIPRTMTEPDMRPSGLTRSPSNRRLSKLPSSTNLAGDSGSPTRKPPSQLPSKIGGLVSKQAKEGGEEMMRAVMTRNMNVGTGRTLVELAQARAGGRPLSMDIGKGIKIGVERMERELPPVPVWDPEKDEMPSPFLSRTKKILV